MGGVPLQNLKIKNSSNQITVFGKVLKKPRCHWVHAAWLENIIYMIKNIKKSLWYTCNLTHPPCLFSRQVYRIDCVNSLCYVGQTKQYLRFLMFQTMFNMLALCNYYNLVLYCIFDMKVIIIYCVLFIILNHEFV